MTEASESGIRRKVGGAILAVTLATGACVPQEKKPSISSEQGSQPVEVLPSEKIIDSLIRGEIQEGESLTSAVERTLETSLSTQGTLALVLNHNNNESSLIFKNKNAFLWQGIVPLPFVFPGDTFVMGSEKEMEKALSESNLATGKNKMVLDSRTKLDSQGGVERSLFVSGGRFDKKVFFKLNEQLGVWEVNIKADRWAESDEFKEPMDNDQNLTSSRVLQQLSGE